MENILRWDYTAILTSSNIYISLVPCDKEEEMIYDLAKLDKNEPLCKAYIMRNGSFYYDPKFFNLGSSYEGIDFDILNKYQNMTGLYPSILVYSLDENKYRVINSQDNLIKYCICDISRIDDISHMNIMDSKLKIHINLMMFLLAETFFLCGKRIPQSTADAVINAFPQLSCFVDKNNIMQCQLEDIYDCINELEENK